MRVLLADDHATLRVALRDLLSGIAGFEVVAECADGAQALIAVAEHRPDLVLMDINMPVLDGIEATLAIKERFPAVRVVALSGFEDAAKVSAMIAAGASGYLVKAGEPRDLVEGLQAIVDGKPVLAPEVLQGVLDDVARFYREQRARADLLADVDRMKRQFFTLVSDDLRNPLAAITGYSRTLRQSADRLDDATKTEFLERIEQQTLRLARRVEQILTISGIRRTESWEAAEFDLGSVAREALQRVGDGTRASCHGLPSLEVRGDRAGVVAVTMALVENAVVHTPGPVEVSVEPGPRDHGALVVRDHGPGVPADRLERLLAGPFARLEQGPELEEGGSLGLSLYIAKQVMEAMGGALEAVSDEAVGSAFTLLVPRG